MTEEGPLSLELTTVRVFLRFVKGMNGETKSLLILGLRISDDDFKVGRLKTSD